MSLIGQALPRIDGPLKLTGTAKYSSAHNFADMVYGVPVGSTIANGRIASLDVEAAREMPGVVEVWVAPLAALFTAAGQSPAQARVGARLGIAVTRGLLLDVLATGETAETDAAMALFLELINGRVTS